MLPFLIDPRQSVSEYGVVCTLLPCTCLFALSPLLCSTNWTRLGLLTQAWPPPPSLFARSGIPTPRSEGPTSVLSSSCPHGVTDRAHLYQAAFHADWRLLKPYRA